MLQALQPGDPRAVGPYVLVGQLGSGGMGRVFMGRSMGGRLVAVKIIRSDLAADPDFRVRFRREVAAARRVSGLYTAMVVDADVDAEEPWLATAYVAGPSLAEAIHDHGPLPPTSALALAAGLAESLVAIHKAGVVHRDLKPSNVLLAEDGPRLIDFGISRAAETTSVTRAGFVIGSPGFMSPEQAKGGEVGPPSDMFSLGAVLAFASTGEPPFGSGSTAALVFRVVFEPPQLDAVPDQVRPLVERCLAKDPSQRPSAGELLTEIGAMQPVAGWLPDPVANALPGIQAQVVTEPPPSPPAAEAAEPSAAPRDTSPTVTGYTPFIAAEPEIVTPAPGTVSPEADTVPQDAGTVPPDARTVPPEAGTLPPEAETVPPDPETGPTELGTAALGAGPGPEPDTAPELVRGPESEPGAIVVPLPGGDRQGGRRPRLRRPLVLGAAAAVVILIASGAAALALSGPGHHPSASATTRPTTVAVATSPTTTPAAEITHGLPQPTAIRTSRHVSAASSGRPSTQPTTANTPTPTTAPAPATSAAAPQPKPTHTAAPGYTFSVSGATKDSCSDVGSVDSSAGASVQFSFADNGSTDLQIDEISASGSLEPTATLAPGVSYQAGTNIGAYWVVENSGGGCLAVFDINGAGQVTVS
jgi:eukaryotic-like serine/threonine-protein kinase